MPVAAYFGGHGTAVMKDIQARYGTKKGRRVFYATAKKTAQEPRSMHDVLVDHAKRGTFTTQKKGR